MKCEEVRDELIAYARGELDDARKAAVEEHLARCEGCTKELEGSRRVMALTQMADDTSIKHVAHDLIGTAVRRGASDLHVEMFPDGPRVRFRIDGILHDGPAVPREQYEPLVARIKMMAEMNVSENRLPQDGRIGITHAKKDYDLRVNVCPFLHGNSVVMRILDRSRVLLGLDRLGLYPDTLAQVESVITRRDGLFFTTGPTGAGKSTLLYSILNKLNRPEVKILTIEDPVEYSLPGVNQMAVHRRAGLTYATAMRALMRQDPDIMMVGAIRDLEIAEMAIQASLTGHLVLSTLDTKDAPSSVTHLVHMGVEPFLIAATLIGSLAQRLARKICPNCREEYEVDAAELRGFGFKPEAGDQKVTLWRGRGCEQCRNTGYLGRTGIFEMMVVNDAIADLIARRAPLADIREAARANGMKTLKEDGLRKVLEGITTPEEVRRVVFTAGH